MTTGKPKQHPSNPAQPSSHQRPCSRATPLQWLPLAAVQAHLPSRPLTHTIMALGSGPVSTLLALLRLSQHPVAHLPP